MTLYAQSWLVVVVFLTACYSAQTIDPDVGSSTDGTARSARDTEPSVAPETDDPWLVPDTDTETTPTPRGDTGTSLDTATDEGVDSMSDTDPLADTDSGTEVQPDTDTATAAHTETDRESDADTDSETSLCGNGVLDTGEACEDGNPLLDDYCNDQCQMEPDYLERCGDGILDPGEECDDGNGVSGDGCGGTCCVEYGWWWPYCTPRYACRCGDGVIQRGEACDDGNREEGDGCAFCALEPETPCPDGVVDEGEACDDGNTDNTDACDNLCRRNPCWVVVVCGNGVLELGEVCDDANVTSDDGCSQDCASVEPGYWCPRPGAPCERIPDAGVDGGGGDRTHCGDGVVQSDLEECDDGENDGGYGECAPGCVLGPYCGDGIIQSEHEACDDGNDTNDDQCTNTCRHVPTGIL